MLPRKRNSKKLFENKSFTLMKNLHKLIAWETEILCITALMYLWEVCVSSHCPLVRPSSVGQSINSLTSPSHLQRLPVVIFRINCSNGAGRWTEMSFPTHMFCKIYHLSVFWKMHHFRMWSSATLDLLLSIKWSQISRQPRLANWMFCNGDSWIITISRSKSVTRRCSWLVGFSGWLYNHR